MGPPKPAEMAGSTIDNPETHTDSVTRTVQELLEEAGDLSSGYTQPTAEVRVLGRRIQEKNDVECSCCGMPITYRSKTKLSQIFVSVYKPGLTTVEFAGKQEELHQEVARLRFHESCYNASDQPFGEPHSRLARDKLNAVGESVQFEAELSTIALSETVVLIPNPPSKSVEATNRTTSYQNYLRKLNKPD